MSSPTDEMVALMVAPVFGGEPAGGVDGGLQLVGLAAPGNQPSAFLEPWTAAVGVEYGGSGLGLVSG